MPDCFRISLIMLRTLKYFGTRNNADLRVLSLLCRAKWSDNLIKKNSSLQRSQQNFRSLKSLQSFQLIRRSYSSFQNVLSFHNITDETLEGLSDFFDEMADSLPTPDDYDVQFGDGVLTVQFGGEVGTYVINKQTPNQQIWLSSPTSGPKRYDFINNKWVYKRDQVSLHDLLSREMSNITGQSVDFTHLPYGRGTSEED